jgi:hypothetical protein
MSAILPNATNLTRGRQRQHVIGGVPVFADIWPSSETHKSRYLIAASPATVRPGRVLQYAPGTTEMAQNVTSINAFTAPLFAGVATYSNQDRFNRTPNYFGSTATDINVYEHPKGKFLDGLVDREVWVETSAVAAPLRGAVVSVLPDGRVGIAGTGVDLLPAQAIFTGLFEANIEGRNYAAVQIVTKLV